MRCQADHRDGGVCLRQLRYWDNSCPGVADHADNND